MNTQETQDILNAFASELIEGVRNAGAFVMEQIPIVLQEYITWGVIKGLILFVAAIAVHFGVRKWIVGPMRISREELRKRESLDVIDYNAGIIILTVVTVGLSIAMFFVGLLPAIKAMVAPRVYLLEELSKLVK